MLRFPVYIAIVVIAAAELNAQTIRREGTITLPPSASMSTQFLPRTMAICRSGDRFAAILSDKTVRVWKLPSGTLAKTVETGQLARTLEFSSDCRLLAIADRTGALNVWDTTSWQLQRKIMPTSPLSVLAISPDKQLIAGGGSSEEEVWDLATGQHLATVRPSFGQSMAISFSPSSMLLATADNDTAIRVYDARTGVLRSSVTELLLETFALAFSPDSRHLLVGGADHTISIADAVAGKIQRVLPKQPGVLGNLIVSADGSHIGALYYPRDRFDHLAVGLVWDLGTSSVIAQFEEKSSELLPSAAFVGNRLLLTTAHGNDIGIWSLQIPR